jgi:RimJ/RimL family protein N-acetyltransferase
MADDQEAHKNVKYVVRPALPDDVPKIADLHCRSADAAFTKFIAKDRLHSSREALERDWANHLRDQSKFERIAIVADTGEEIVGVVEAGREPSDLAIGRLARGYIDPAWWDTGVGGSILDAAIAHLRELGCDTAMGWIMEHNQRAQTYMGHKGMSPTGRRQPSCEATAPPGTEDIQYQMRI